MIIKLGELAGWLLIICYISTILNYVIKGLNKRFKKQFSNPKTKQIISTLMKIFVKNHKKFGYATIIFLLIHVIIQFSNYGMNITGLIAAILIIIQVLLGMYGSYVNRKRAGVWFILHRIIAILIVLGIVVHLLFPQLLKNGNSKGLVKGDISISENNGKVFTLEELATYDGKNGQSAYVAYNGIVYDVTDVPEWENGDHNGKRAGIDLTSEISQSPHGDSVFNDLPVVGILE